MFKRWIKFLIYLLVIGGVSSSFALITLYIILDAPRDGYAVVWAGISVTTFFVTAGLLVVSLVASLVARSIKQGRLSALQALPKWMSDGMTWMFEGMTFFKWGILIIGLILALAFLQIAGN